MASFAETALAQGTEVMKRFLVQNTRVNDLIMFTEMVGDQPYDSAEDVPLSVLLPAFIVRAENGVPDRLSVSAISRD